MRTFVSTIAILLIIIIIAFTLYSTKPIQINQPTQTKIIIKYVKMKISGAFYNGKVISFVYINTTCLSQQVNLTQQNVASYENSIKFANYCGTFILNASVFPKGAQPLFVLLPVFAGPSIFGLKELNASREGFPVFNNQTVLTQCGATNTQAQCPDNLTLVFSGGILLYEKYVNRTFAGLPLGVLYFPAHDILVNSITQNETTACYLVIVKVYDPNIFPNPLTGRCQQVVPSNLTNATGNCLNNINALIRAMKTITAASVQYYSALPPNLGTEVETQAIVPGIYNTNLLFSLSNTNIVIFGNTTNEYPI
ncbi:MAG: hypothetical protein RXR31_06925 [Thermoproteota archaeon]|jgi:hypothetical protein